MNETTAMSAPEAPGKGKTWLFRLGLLAFTLLLTLGIGEVSARLLGLAPPYFPEADTAMILYYEDPQGLIELTPDWEGYVGFVWTRINARGFRDRVFDPAPSEGTTRIAFLGDSYVMGDGVKEEETIPKVLETRLREQVPCEVMNCGVSATNSENQVQILRGVLRDYHPDMVLLGFNVNDFHTPPDTRFQRYVRTGHAYTVHPDRRVTVRRDMSALQRIKTAVRDHSYLWRWVSGIRAGMAVRAENPAEADFLARVRGWIDSGGPKRAFDAVGSMKRLCEEKGVPFLVLLIPDLLDVPPDVRSMSDYPFLKEHRMIVDELRQRGVECLDLLPALGRRSPSSLEAHRFNRHFNAEGNAILADAALARVSREVAACAGRPKPGR